MSCDLGWSNQAEVLVGAPRKDQQFLTWGLPDCPGLLQVSRASPWAEGQCGKSAPSFLSQLKNRVHLGKLLSSSVLQLPLKRGHGNLTSV